MHDWTCIQKQQTKEQHNMLKATLVSFLRSRAFQHLPANGQNCCLTLILRESPERFCEQLKNHIDSREHSG